MAYLFVAFLAFYGATIGGSLLGLSIADRDRAGILTSLAFVAAMVAIVFASTYYAYVELS